MLFLIRELKYELTSIEIKVFDAEIFKENDCTLRQTSLLST